MIAFEILGDPAPKGSKTTGTRNNGTRYTRESSKRLGPWLTSAIQQLAAQTQQLRAPLTGPLDVTVRFECERPARPAHPYPSKGDGDKFERALLDALTQALVIADDRHVVRCTWVKSYAETGALPRMRGFVAPLDPNDLP